MVLPMWYGYKKEYLDLIKEQGVTDEPSIYIRDHSINPIGLVS